jgi:hypothetical protein
MKKVVVLSVLVAALSSLFLGCDNANNPTPTYFVALGTLSEQGKKWQLYCDTAQEAYAYVLRYAAYPDPYRSSDSGITRQELVDTIDSSPGLKPSKAQILKALDETGVLFTELVVIATGELLYAYIEAE